MPRLRGALAGEEDLALEDLLSNPGCYDVNLKVGDRHSSLVNLETDRVSPVPAYSLLVTAVTPAPLETRTDREAFFTASFGRVRQNRLRHRPLPQILMFLLGRRRRGNFRTVTDKVCLLRHAYRNLTLPAEIFAGSGSLLLNGHRFPAVARPEALLAHWYRKPPEKYPPAPVFHRKFWIFQPDLPFVPQRPAKRDLKTALLRRIGRFLGWIVKREMRFVLRERRFFFRAIDRFALKDLFGPRMPALRAARAAEDWAALGSLLREYLELAPRYQSWNLPFAFDRECYDMLLDLLLYSLEPSGTSLKTTARRARLHLWLTENRKKAFAYLDRVERRESPAPSLSGAGRTGT